MHTLALPRIYRTIFSCGTFGLGGGGGQGALALRLLYAHLAPGGVLALDTGRPAVEATQLDAWIARMASQPAAGWPETGDRRRAADGDELELRTRRVAVDPDTRVMTQQIQARLWRGEDVIQEEEHTLTMGLFSTEELLGMLRQTGFRQVDVTDGYVGGIGGGDQPVAVYVARR